MVLIIFILGIIVLGGIGLSSVIYFNWNKNKVYLNKLNDKNGIVFSDLKISTNSSGKMKSLLGFTAHSQIFIHPEYIFLLAEGMSISLIQTELPIVFDKKSGFIPEMVKLNSWNSITIIVKKRTFSLGHTKMEILVETVNKEQKELLFNELKNWWNI